MTAWSQFYGKVSAIVEHAGSNLVYFRGHEQHTWRLLPGIGRLHPSSYSGYGHGDDALHVFENDAYYDFVSGAGDLISRGNSSWDNLFLMQHHGLPTRLLDWTESFAIALFFALRSAPANPAIWILDPYILNERTFQKLWIPDVADLAGEYHEYFLARTKVFPGDVVALRPTRHIRRLAQQVSAFTLHNRVDGPLEELRPDALKKIRLPKTGIADALLFLRLAGISEYTLFPDLDGLARHLRKECVFDDTK